MRQFQVRRIWKGRLPAENPGCLSDLEWAVLVRHVKDGKPVDYRLKEVLHDASTALLIYYAFEKDKGWAETYFGGLFDELNARLGEENDDQGVG